MTSTKHRTILVMAGGTGGHVFPALAVADNLREEGWKVIWLGTKSGMEAKLVPQRGYEMAWLKFSGVRGNGLVRWMVLPFQILIAFYQSAAVIFKQRPDVVLGMGGYTAFPGGMMAVLLAKPLVIHEQNSIAGLTNRVLACLADKVMVAFPGAFKGKVDKPLLCARPETIWCGNPVRKEIAEITEPVKRFEGRTGKLRLLVVGGSLGATALNDVVPKAVALMPEEKRPEIVHQAGAKHMDSLEANYVAAGVSAEVKTFIDDIASLYAWCDVVICRAGALTVSELTAAGLGSVLVPYPYAVDDHQTDNARFLSDNHAAILIPQKELTAEKIHELLLNLDRENLVKMAVAARKLAKPEATNEVADMCRELANAA
ncbi:undecaprenyldiphospho-muramoylpentapeptide beta-N-acetylglucosaminyltransferase [Sulfurirhabdus autotrophica]|uniref:UDP-N-acetylglucosamine--N-acetylmuramyl-(pentapeptide) pyrophosphoryl-undecaprenol N-acetylglucosamine transferase n=1 Tax=Sulfurirhabdus autotrophica TaxID=1706046 RepID=A0A4V2W161_9PROT|nr:undecaprenyldiphospho-muramoylpentapeptide beta-N-acetylglucosaminyltransferase [Sulfurirhabdus autotrophica]TCV83019.1 UDP-N-acetylglucosamine-N-acetylmuramylpentapeptide N-acetylglucosamine transferase [Sulfurirhabdus autotrophica]